MLLKDFSPPRRASFIAAIFYNLKFRDAEGYPSSIWDELAFLDGPLLR